MKYEENMSGWRKALEEKRIESKHAEEDRCLMQILKTAA